MQLLKKTVLISLAFFTFILTIPSLAAEKEATFIGKNLTVKKMEIPACTPMNLKAGKKTIQLRDTSRVWPKLKLKKEVFAGYKIHEKFADCVNHFAGYRDRFEKEHVDALRTGSFAVGMPVEFALMVLGPPSQPASVMSFLNPATGKPQTIKTFIWMNMFGRRSGLQTFFSVLGASALGVASASSHLGTTIDALTVANSANLANLTTWSVSNSSGFNLVTIQVDEQNRITMFSSM